MDSCILDMEMRQAISQVFKEKTEIDKMPKSEKMVKCETLLQPSEKKLKSNTTFFAIEIHGMKFLVRPHDYIPIEAKLVRTIKNQPVRVAANISG